MSELGREYVQGELNALCAALRDPSDETVEAVAEAIRQETWGDRDPGPGEDWTSEAREAIAALARAVGVAE